MIPEDVAGLARKLAEQMLFAFANSGESVREVLVRKFSVSLPSSSIFSSMLIG